MLAISYFRNSGTGISRLINCSGFNIKGELPSTNKKKIIKLKKKT
jgi:hypothetical protein